jgi:hypothetical protein
MSPRKAPPFSDVLHELDVFPASATLRAASTGARGATRWRRGSGDGGRGDAMPGGGVTSTTVARAGTR